MDIIYVFLGTAIGVGLAYLFFVYKRKQVIRNEVDILMTQIKSVSKLVTVEGEFSEVYQHKEKNKYFFKLLSSEKKALIIVKAKVLMGYDLNKLKFTLDNLNKTLRFDSLPLIEILHLSTDVEYFDISNGTFNKFSKDELKQITEEAKAFMKEKIYDSDLPKLALDQGNEGLKFIEQTSKDLGWKIIKS